MKYVAAALIAFMAGIFTRGLFADRALHRLQVTNDSAKVELAYRDSLRAADRVAFDAERAGWSAQVSLRSSRSVETGTAAASLVDTLYLNALPDCKPALAEIALRFAEHLHADTLFAQSVDSLKRVDSLELDRRASESATFARLAREAQQRTDDAIRAGRAGHGWKTDALLVLGTAAVVMIVRP
jgi:hypothetical protein